MSYYLDLMLSVVSLCLCVAYGMFLSECVNMQRSEEVARSFLLFLFASAGLAAWQ